MPEYFAVLTMILLIGMVITRTLLLKRQGIAAMQFGKLDKTDFLIPPFALLYLYLIFAHAFGWPTLAQQEMLSSETLGWVGALLCLTGLALFVWSLVSFGQSFRVGIDVEHPGKLMTSGAFAISRNPIYVAFALVLAGQFLIFSHWLLLVYLVAAVWLFNRQVLSEEAYLKQHYGQEYLAYCQRVRRYI